MQFQLSFSLAESASRGPELCTIPAGPYFPVPLSIDRDLLSVGACGIIGPFPQVGMPKGSLRTREFGGRCSHYFAGGLALWRRRNSIRRYSTAPEREFRSQFPLFPLYDSSSAVLSFQLHPIFGAVSNRVPPSSTMSRSVGFGDKSWDNLKNIFQTQGFEFLFLSQSARRVAFGGSMAPKTPVLKLNRPFACKPPAAIASELTRVACAPFAKPQVAGLRHS